MRICLFILVSLLLISCTSKSTIDRGIYYSDTFRYHDHYAASRTNQFYGFTDLSKALKCAKDHKRNLLLSFSSFNSMSISDLDLKLLGLYGDNDFIGRNFIIVRCMVDENTPLVDTYFAKLINADTTHLLTIGDQNLAVQLNLFKSNQIPLLAFLDTNMCPYGSRLVFSRYNKEDAIAFIRSGLKQD